MDKKQKAKPARSGLQIFLLIVCAGVFAVSAFHLFRYFAANHKAESDFDDLRPPVSEDADDVADEDDEQTYGDLLPYYQKLKAENGDFVGWLQIPDTNIDYPVMQTKKVPEYYIDKNFKKEFSAAGSLFCSEISDAEKPSDAIIIYGHHMKTGAMFGSLEKFLEQDYFDAHKTVIFDTLSRRDVFQVYGLFKTQVYTNDPAEFAYYAVSDFGSKAEFSAFLQEINAKMQIKDDANKPILGDKIIMLSTCEYSQTNGRLVLVAVRK